ncbi:hypothetical protein [Brevundimonas sp.]|jgi:hypothetical protein|uniref:hypothetical protein n=1 Tax=Brevundimonas sp. TaxID=1871086 RepID=UPI0035676EB0
MIGQLRLVLYHRGQVHEPPRKIMPSAVVRAAQPAMGVLVEKWLERRAPTLRPATLYHLALTVRSFLDHLAATAPAIQTFAAVKHQHVVSWMNAMATDPSLKTGRPLTPHSQRGRVVRLAQFYKDAEDWHGQTCRGGRWSPVAICRASPSASRAISRAPILIG